MNITIKFRRDLASNWTKNNTVLSEGEPGYELDTGKLKIGNGTARWTDLAYFAAGTSFPNPDVQYLQNLIAEYCANLTPQIVYEVFDDGPSLALLYQNVKV